MKNNDEYTQGRLKHGDVILYNDTVLVINDSHECVNGMTFYHQTSQQHIIDEEAVRRQSNVIATLPVFTRDECLRYLEQIAHRLSPYEPRRTYLHHERDRFSQYPTTWKVYQYLIIAGLEKVLDPSKNPPQNEESIPYPSVEELYAYIYRCIYPLSDDLEYELQVLCNTQTAINDTHSRVGSLVWGFLGYETYTCNVAFDTENVFDAQDPSRFKATNNLIGLHRVMLDSGRTVDMCGFFAGGDWEFGVIAFLFINKNHQFEIHVPELPQYNPYNVYTKQSFGNGDGDYRCRARGLTALLTSPLYTHEALYKYYLYKETMDDLGAQYLGYNTYKELCEKERTQEEESTSWDHIHHYMKQYLTCHFSDTRMNQKRENEARKRAREYEKKIAEIQTHKANLEAIKKDLFPLFTETNTQQRGKTLEKVLNRYFREFQVLVKEDFKREGEPGEGIIEQIDGIIEVDHQIYLVEMKWKKDRIGGDDICAHLGRIYHRSNAHGIFISASGYSPSGTTAAKEALEKNALLVLFDLEEFVRVLESETDFKQYLKDKIRAAIIDKEPYKRP